MSDRPYLISVDLGPVATAAMKELLEANPKRTQSDLIRDALLIAHQFNLIGKLANQVNRAIAVKVTVPPVKKPRKATEEERSIVDVYKDVYHFNGNIYWPPALNCIRAARRNGLSYDTITEIVRVSINDSFLSQLLGRGERPGLHVILSEKMIAQLLPRAQVSAGDEADRAQLRLEGTIKPDALSTLKGALTSENYSKAWDLINECMTPNDVDMVVKAAMEGTLKEWEERDRSFLEVLGDNE